MAQQRTREEASTTLHSAAHHCNVMTARQCAIDLCKTANVRTRMCIIAASEIPRCAELTPHTKPLQICQKSNEKEKSSKNEESAENEQIGQN